MRLKEGAPWWDSQGEMFKRIDQTHLMPNVFELFLKRVHRQAQALFVAVADAGFHVLKQIEIIFFLSGDGKNAFHAQIRRPFHVSVHGDGKIWLEFQTRFVGYHQNAAGLAQGADILVEACHIQGRRQHGHSQRLAQDVRAQHDEVMTVFDEELPEFFNELRAGGAASMDTYNVHNSFSPEIE